MRTIHVVGQPTCQRLYYYPVIVFKEELLDLGLTAKFFSNPLAPDVENCDVLIFHEDNYRDLLPIKAKERTHALDFLQGFFAKFPRVIWFDDNDASGWLRNYVFPLVDVYAKPQLLKDVKYYQENHKIGDMHRDFVHEKYQIDDLHVSKGAITEADVHKLRISWNMALKNWNRFDIHVPIIMKLVNQYSKGYRIRYTLPDLANRGKIIPYRVSYWESNPTVTWWRKKTEEAIARVIRQNPSFRMTSRGIVNSWQYNTEMRNTLVTVSPFGIGEICYRDFESFFHGSLLFKPKMNHIRTWPDLYIDGKTYISHEWDFSDFEAKLSSILSYPQRYEDVAREGQKQFRNALADGPSFAEHFKRMVN
jgi:hypothetical protein